MPSWIHRGHETQEPVILEPLLDVRYLRYCPACEDFKPQETIIDDHDRILRCVVCGTEERFVFSEGVLVPKGTLPLLKMFAQKRVKEILKNGR